MAAHFFDLQLLMKLQAQVGDAIHQIEITREGDRVSASIDGRNYELEASEPEPSVFLLKHNGRIHEVFVSPNAKSNEPYRVSVGGKEIDVRMVDPKRLRGTEAKTVHGDGRAEIKTAMPGKVVRIVAEKGSTVAKGDTVLVVEAMKMQNELRSPKDGVVSEIRAEEGATAGAGDILAVVE